MNATRAPRMTGEEIRAARKALGMTQTEFAALLHYTSKTTISGLETDRDSICPRAQELLQLYLAIREAANPWERLVPTSVGACRTRLRALVTTLRKTDDA